MYAAWIKVMCVFLIELGLYNIHGSTVQKSISGEKSALHICQSIMVNSHLPSLT